MLEYISAIYYITLIPFLGSVTLILIIVIYSECQLFNEDLKDHLLQDAVVEDLELTVEECNLQLLPLEEDLNVTVLNMNTLYNF